MRMLAGSLAGEQFIQFAAFIERTHFVETADVDVADKYLWNRATAAAALLHFIEAGRIP